MKGGKGGEGRCQGKKKAKIPSKEGRKKGGEEEEGGRKEEGGKKSRRRGRGRRRRGERGGGALVAVEPNGLDEARGLVVAAGNPAKGVGGRYRKKSHN
jgi:hypothetical protein